jgi:hypothetical protein
VEQPIRLPCVPGGKLIYNHLVVDYGLDGRAVKGLRGGVADHFREKGRRPQAMLERR